MRRLVLLNLILWLAVAAAAGAAGFFFWDKAQYIRTNQAQVGADLVVISAPEVGRLTQWSAKTGDRISAGAVLGTLQPLASIPSSMAGAGSASGAGAPSGSGSAGIAPGAGQGAAGRTAGTAPTAPAAPGGRATAFGAVSGASAARANATSSPALQALASQVGTTHNRETTRNRSTVRSRSAPGSQPAARRSRVHTGLPPASPRPASPNTAPPSAAPVPALPTPVNLTSPIDGVVLYTAAIPGAIWVPGWTLAVVADLSKPFVTAYIDDNILKNLSVGKDVDVFLDAYPGTSFPGKVVRIADAAGSFAAPELPSAAGTNQTRPTERVPVRIAVDDFSGKYVVPGMNASVRIHR
ncbi:hypothetical protein CVV65_15415 [Kyrpidia spormannii]|uniref:RND efflux pump membrane fusion protein barrel-sandwich domain-containing protein n=1 Tax=Kyrpidia spormannii TaxID=2055160 RepID=A0A2K8NA12_9BACL|nr:HlyD family efflux transporter periplasmic adaptor subunit [Kyrpidia spormannii]ATY86143.1 hypothetical protein CVV65_15415 [Kyrpidia spormannii]